MKSTCGSGDLSLFFGSINHLHLSLFGASSASRLAVVVWDDGSSFELRTENCLGMDFYSCLIIGKVEIDTARLGGETCSKICVWLQVACQVATEVVWQRAIASVRRYSYYCWRQIESLSL